MIYKHELAQRLFNLLKQSFPDLEKNRTCCRHQHSCGDSFFGEVPAAQVKAQMQRRAELVQIIAVH